ncbi:hypothetical protein HCJ70_15700 [Listeria booriae]|uniref:hypothetical protein n=1 Tax=Listeria booriae TaxID=1552123 RepID=UPI0016243ED2|nr:hypothetical protein [Listeria booriae]MBC2100497.1 hypothetical protein [Listeria booriae]
MGLMFGWLIVASSFESQLLEVFTAFIKIKGGFLLRLLQTFSELDGLSCCGSYEA